MDPKRHRFSDLRSDSDSSMRSSVPSGASSTSTDLVLRLSTSFTSISTASVPSTNGHRDSNDDFQYPLPVTAAPPSHSTEPLERQSRQSVSTVASGTTVWTVHGSARTTMGVGMPPSSATETAESRENTEHIDHQEAIKLRRRTVATVSSNNSCRSEERSVTPKANLSSSSPTLNVQRKPISIADDTEELPPTQPSGPLKDVVAYVEVYSGADNRSAVIGNALRDLGATVCRRLTNKVTHVVFREGRQSIVERARCRDAYLVSVLWVEACQREKERVPESDYGIARRERKTPMNLGRARRFRSMQPKPMEAELALTDDRMRKRKQRLEASKQKREVRKEIREGRIVGMSSATKQTIDPGNSFSAETPVLKAPLQAPLSRTHTGGWNSDDDDETPPSLRRQVADVRKKILGSLDTPSTSRRDSSLGNSETLAESIRKKLFDSGGTLHGTPLPSFLDRPKRTTRSARSATNDAQSELQRNKAPSDLRQSHRCLRDMNSLDGSRFGPSDTRANMEIDRNGSEFSKIDGIVAAVCEKVRNMDIESGRRSQTRRQIFDRESERISDAMLCTPDLSGQEAPSKSLTARVAAKNASVEIDDVFGPESTFANDGKGKATSKKGNNNEEMVRLRSSLFQVKSTSDIVRQLQMGRRSSEEFQSLRSAIRKTKRSKTTTKNRAPSKKATVHPSPSVKRKPKGRRTRSSRHLVMTNVKQDDRELIYTIVKRLKGFRIQNKVTADTTHVVCGENRRTLNVLMGVARGCWMLPIEWVYHSLANGEWLGEEQFDLADQFPSAQAIRKGKKAGLGDVDFSATCRIFDGVGPFYVFPSSQPPSMDLCSLIRWCGGKIALTSKRASFCVGCQATHDDAVGVKETWILDSIMQNRRVPVDGYLIPGK